MSDYDMVSLFLIYWLVGRVEKVLMFSTPYHTGREDLLPCDTIK